MNAILSEPLDIDIAMTLHPLCQVTDIEPDQAIKVLYQEQEIIVVRRGEQAFAYYNRCPHAGAKLDMNSENLISFDQFHLFCSVHGALFHPATGYCVAGPCSGQSLTPLPVTIREGKVCVFSDGTHDEV
ncbi:Rieske (2Fe-2S) protein [Pleionea sp. CnH1-48]|uniref:Rieske (2Fe-2S) protein n=1 Tax=Pleionea sp. CnH1-48 TaxID=2954494 RepID=UPI002097B4E5|nr:Rieske (2Fe-2S) protein [Pleionea sp. CnH1-48]MCO7227350.1 Rieske (2Fe-2S) protein [Pleionea sp. CnH1-48]